MSEVFARETFDPRKHSVVALSVVDRQPHYTGQDRGESIGLKHMVVGPNVPARSLSLRRPITAPVPRRFPNGTIDPQPKILNQNCKWVQGEMPMLIADSQAQPLTSTTTFTATLPPGTAAQRAMRPVTAIHSYNDVSPVIQADMVRDTDMDATIIKDSTATRPRSATSNMLKKSMAMANSPQAQTIRARTAALNGTGPTSVPLPDSRTQSLNAFLARQAGATFNLGISDLDRVEELGKNVVAGGANCRLIGSRWRYIQRPADGDVVYTDYYGRCGEKMNDYYGRAYHVGLSQFNRNRLVGDSDYIKVQASMPGIYTLRTRPGLVLDSTIVNGPQDELAVLRLVQTQGLTEESGIMVAPAGLQRCNHLPDTQLHTCSLPTCRTCTAAGSSGSTDRTWPAQAE